MIKVKNAVPATLAELPTNVQDRLNSPIVTLTKGTYKVHGLFKVTPEKGSTMDKEWYGIKLEDERGNEVVVGLNTMLGVTIVGTPESGYTVNTVSKRRFFAYSEIEKVFNKKIEVIDFEGLETQVFGKDSTKVKQMPIFK